MKTFLRLLVNLCASLVLSACTVPQGTSPPAAPGSSPTGGGAAAPQIITELAGEGSTDLAGGAAATGGGSGGGGESEGGGEGAYAGGGSEAGSFAAQPGGMPSGPVAPGAVYEGEHVYLNAGYWRDCLEGFEDRIRVQFRGAIRSTNDDPKICAFDGKRALRIVYWVGKGRGGMKLRTRDVPISDEGKVEAAFSTSRPDHRRFYLVHRDQETVTAEKPCAQYSCVDSDLNGEVDPGICRLITLPIMGSGVVEVFPHHQGPLTACPTSSMILPDDVMKKVWVK